LSVSNAGPASILLDELNARLLQCALDLEPRRMRRLTLLVLEIAQCLHSNACALGKLDLPHRKHHPGSLACSRRHEASRDAWFARVNCGRHDKPSVLNKSVTVVTPSRHTNWALVAIAYGFFALGIGINIWNASTGAITDMALPAALGVLAEAVVFFLPAWALTLPVGRQVLAWALFVFISVFALTNSLRMASIIAADQATIRADRQTEGVRSADHALEAARSMRDQACGRGLGKTVACKVRQAEVAKLETSQTQATAKVAAQARPESTDFAKLVTWASRGAVQPGADDFAMLWLLFRTFLPQVGGLVLMLAQRRTA
jgi:hypothetical protein